MNRPVKPGVVFDCNIFFQATRNTAGPAARVLRMLGTGALSLFVSGAVLEEVRETLTDPGLRAKNRAITDESVGALLEYLGANATLVQDVPERFSYERDPDDAKYVNLALAANAAYLVTRDNDLLDLMGDVAFRARYPDLTILDPVAFLQIRPPEREADNPEQASGGDGSPPPA